MEQLLQVEHVKKTYGTYKAAVKALDDVSFTINKGEYVAIMGASGSGKTTLLNCISTIDSVSAGRIILNEKDLTEISEREISEFRRHHLGFIFQDYNLLDTLTVYENIALALTLNKVEVSVIDDQICHIAERLAIKDILGKFPYEISGGEKQRSACARALINNPSLIIADEPTGALDSASAKKLLLAMDVMNKDMGATILMVTHDAFTASHANRILFLKDGKLYDEIVCGNSSKKEFFNKILAVVTTLGGDFSDVL